MNIVEHDFGKKKRETVKRFCGLLSLDALHERNIKENPLPYLERASERIFQLERALFEAAQVFADVTAESPSGDLIQIDRLEYERLRRCQEIVQRALDDYASDEEF